MTSDYIKHKKAAMTWTMFVMEAVGRAKRTNLPVTLHVGKEQSAMVLQEALLSLAYSGEDAAWNVHIQTHTVH